MLLTGAILAGLLAATHGVNLDTIAMLVCAFMFAYFAATLTTTLIERTAP